MYLNTNTNTFGKYLNTNTNTLYKLDMIKQCMLIWEYDFDIQSNDY